VKNKTQISERLWWDLIFFHDAQELFFFWIKQKLSAITDKQFSSYGCSN
jgi:hypothetical protein